MLTIIPTLKPELVNAYGIDTIPPPTIVLMKAKVAPNELKPSVFVFYNKDSSRHNHFSFSS